MLVVSVELMQKILLKCYPKKTEQKDVSEYTYVQSHVIQQSPEVLNRSHPAARILQNSALIVARQLEMLNVFLVIFYLPVDNRTKS